MTKPNTTPKSAKPAKVQALPPAIVETTPPEGWQLKTEFGFMAFDGTPAGRLVRLADVLRWIEDSKSLPRKKALEILCESMPPDVMQWLYGIQQGDYAKPIPIDYSFGYQSDEQIKKSKYKYLQDLLQREFERDRDTFGGWRDEFNRFNPRGLSRKPNWPEPTTPGIEALLKYINYYWIHEKLSKLSTVSILDDPKIIDLTQMSISLGKAAEIWGYGQILRTVESAPVNYAELVAYRKKHKNSEWADGDVEILRNEVATRTGQPGSRSQIASDFGISEQRISELLIKERPQKRKKSPALKSVY